MITFGTYDAARHPRTAVLVAGLRAHGVKVTELNRPLGFSTAERVRMLQQPWRLPALAARLLRCWAALVSDAVRHRRAEGRPAAVLVGYLGHFDVLLARLLYPRSVVVLDHLVFAGDTAADRGAAGLRVRLLTSLDRLAVACADVVVTDTDEHRRMLPDPDKGVVVLVGAPDEWRTPPVSTSSTGEGSLSVVFFGLFTPLQGAPVLAAALRDAVAARAPLRVTMVGTGQDLPRAREVLAATPGVTWHDWVEPGELPALVAAHDVCLGIFGDTPKGLRVVPNKVYQGLAAGCVVVTSDTPPQRRALGEHVELVPVADAAALAAELVRLGDPAALAAARARAARGRDRIRPQVVAEPLVAELRRRDAL
ncbi:glycosyltransferase [Promicromonospora sukumoe]|uniref:Glycosyltransferase involved in cell wall biosynthesis n=1 Tax=Promicromonospora sukumoe TaxID=88382 RepID=A0A7W3JC09_9MICO|nr:glycosyltransferase [Promicromonospora sukumoe]MBA8810024.1 glycosyltransferase involved in cell wall biosynthesis [Promicromonospora sukumoe]